MSNEKGAPIFQSQYRDRDQDGRVPALKRGLYTGVVVGSLLPNNLITVRLEDQDREINCVWTAGFMSGLLGFKTTYSPPIKTRVVVFYTCEDISFILQAVPQPSVDPFLQRSVTDPDAAPYGSSQVHEVRKVGSTRVMDAHKPPIDMVEGELDISNMMGVGLSLLRNLAALSAGDLARVECHLMDDMVRMISGTFKHHSAIGDHKIYNDGGRLNMEWHGAGYAYEAYGNLTPEQHQTSMKDVNTPDLGNNSQIDGYNDDGRWRLSQYVGWMGDFVNLFVTDPVNALGRLASDQLRAGKFRAHINEDGAFLMQSVCEIVLEKVVAIPVPIRIRREDDPTGNISSGSIGRQEFLQNWKPSGNLFEMAFQLREYARWLNSTWSLARFRQMDLDFKVPTESDTPAALPSSGDQDKVAVNGETASWRLGYATIRIMRDGSIVQMDAYGNSMVSTVDGVHISSVKDLFLEAAGSVNIVAGRDINLVAKNNVNLSAITQAVRIKAQTGLLMLVAAGNAVLDFVGERIFKIAAKVNIADAVELDKAGNVNALGNVTAITLSASVTVTEDQHPGHVISGAVPVVPPVTDDFKYQSNYGGQELYQSLTQSALARGEQGSSGEWDLSTNAVSGKGAPWPGSSPTHKKAPGGSDLNKPVGTIQTASPQAMTSEGIKLKVQS